MRKFLFKILVAIACLPVAAHAQLLQPNDLTWDSLKIEFNNLSAYPRIVSVLSVNCLPCRLHRDDIRNQVMNACTNPGLRWMIIWMEDPSHPAVRNDAVNQAALINDPRVIQYWFAEHQPQSPKNDSVSYLFGGMPWLGCGYAYDFSLLYSPGVSWAATLPAPGYCMGKITTCCNPYSVGNFKQQVINNGFCNATGIGHLAGNPDVMISQDGDMIEVYIPGNRDALPEMSIYDTGGRKVKALNPHASDGNVFRFRSGELTTGIYMLGITYEGYSAFKRFYVLPR